MTSKCSKCKKFSLVIFDCKCKSSFCTIHRLPEKHECHMLYEYGKIAKDLNEKILNEYSIKKNSNLIRLE
jgi:predicted nucleic acid binding AN1-type Zn finger protein